MFKSWLRTIYHLLNNPLLKMVWKHLHITRRKRLLRASDTLSEVDTKLLLSNQDGRLYKKNFYRIIKYSEIKIQQSSALLEIDHAISGMEALKKIEYNIIKYNIPSALYNLHCAQMMLGYSFDAKVRLEFLLKKNKGVGIAQMSEMLFDLCMDKELKTIGHLRGEKHHVLEKVLPEAIGAETLYKAKGEICQVLPYKCIKMGAFHVVGTEPIFREIVQEVKLLRDVVVDGTFSILDKQRSKFVIYEKCADPSRGVVAGLFYRYYGSNYRLNSVLQYGETKAPKVIRAYSAIHLVGRIPQNLFHLLIEYIPRYLLIIKANLNHKKIPVLVPDNMPYQLFKILRIFLGKNTPLIPVGKNTQVEVKNLYLPSFGSELDDTTFVDMFRCGLYSPSFLQYLRSTLYSVDLSSTNVPEKVYLSRPAGLARDLNNAKEVQTYLKRNGFQVLDPGSLSIEQQMAIFVKSKVIVGVAGASFSWGFMANKGTKVISFVAEDNETYSIQQNITEYSGATHVFVCGERLMDKDMYEGRLHYFHASFRVNISDLEFALSI